MEGASESCLFTLNVCVACWVCCALKLQRKGGRVVKGANRVILVRDYFFLVERSINNIEDDL
jgi:anaerobic selenocysteine-containing dehydrogenase